ncbi:MAG: ABC transporter ATP-binding protein, partial [Planctomycetes bacterium]|nr:ABC transporter ATP-binding protein [Planctomycetota bacterium]
MAMIRIEGFTKRYGGRVVLRDLHLDVGRGETLVVMGASGCGKSTLLRHVAGLEHDETGPFEGRITVGE